MPHMRTVKTASGATAVQIVWSSRGGSRSIDPLGSAHDEVELAALKAAAAERLAAGQTVLDLGAAGRSGAGPLPITSSQMTHLWARLCAAYRVLGLESVAKGDNVFRDLVLARIIEPRTSPMPPAFVSRDGLSDRAKWRSDSSQPGPLARTSGASTHPMRCYPNSMRCYPKWPCGYDVRRPHHRRGDTRQLYDRNDRAMSADADRRARMPGNYQ